MKKKRVARKLGLTTVAVAVASAGFVPVVSANAGVLHTVDFGNLEANKDFKKIEIGFPDYTVQNVLDASKITVVGNVATVESAVIGTGGKLEVEVNNIDPSQNEYTLMIEPGALQFAGYQQMSNIEVKFKPEDILPDFQNLFRNSNAARANVIFNQNQTDQINLFVTGSYISDITAISRIVDGSAAQSTAEIIVSTQDVDIVTISINGEVRRVVQGNDNEFRGAIQGVQLHDDVTVTAYNSSGVVLETQTVLLSEETRTNFRQDLAHDWTERQFTVRDYLTGATDLESLLSSQHIRVGYQFVPYIQYASNGQELARAVAELDRWRAGGAGDNQKAIIRLTGDITNISSQEVVLTNRNLVIESDDPDTPRSINGNFRFGNGTDMEVTLNNVVFTGNVNVHVNTGDATFNNVDVQGTTTITSAGSSSVYLNEFTTNKLVLANNDAARVIAGAGTTIGSTEVRNNGSADTIFVQNGGLFNTITRAGTNGAGAIVLQGSTPYTSVVTGGTSQSTKVVVSEGATLNTLVATRNTNLSGTGTITNINVDQLTTGRVTYAEETTITNLAGLGNKVVKEGATQDTPSVVSSETIEGLEKVSSTLTTMTFKVKNIASETATLTYKVFNVGTELEDKQEVIDNTTDDVPGATDTISLEAGKEGQFTISGLTKGTEYELYVYSSLDANDDIAVSSTIKTNDSTVRAGGTLMNFANTVKDIQNGGRTLTLTLTGTDVTWRDNVVSNQGQADRIAALFVDGSGPALNSALELKPENIRLSQDKRTLTVILPAISDYSQSGDETITIDNPVVGLLTFKNITDREIANDSTSATAERALPTVVDNEIYSNSFDVADVADLRDVELSTGLIPNSGNVSVTLTGLSTDMEYNIGGTTWTDGTGASVTATVQVGQKITVRDIENPQVSRSFDIKAGEAYVTTDDELDTVFTLANVNAGLKKIYLAPGDYDLTTSADAVDIPSGKNVTLATFDSAAGTGAQIDFHAEQNLSRLSFSDNIRAVSTASFSSAVSDDGNSITVTIAAGAKSGTYKVYRAASPNSDGTDLLATIQHTKGTASTGTVTVHASDDNAIEVDGTNGLFYTLTPLNQTAEGKVYSDGAVPVRPTNGDTTDGDFIVNAAEGQVVITNGGTLDDAKAIIRVNGEVVATESFEEGVDLEVELTLEAGQQVSVAVENAEGNRSQFAENVPVAAAVTIPEATDLVEATDGGDNAPAAYVNANGEAAVTFKPAVSLNNGEAVVLVATDGTATVTATATATATEDAVTPVFGGSTGDVTYTGGADGTTGAIDLSSLADGSITVTIYKVDADGNTTLSSVERTITKDTEAPTLTFSSASWTQVGEAGAKTFTLTASEALQANNTVAEGAIASGEGPIATFTVANWTSAPTAFIINAISAGATTVTIVSDAAANDTDDTDPAGAPTEITLGTAGTAAIRDAAGNPVEASVTITP